MSLSITNAATPAIAYSASAAAGSTPAPASISTSADFALLLKPFTPDAFASGFATLVGALIGAMLAYIFQQRLQRSMEHKAALMGAHRLMFSLLQQINTIVLIQRDYVYDELKKPGRFLAIPATPPFDTRKNVLELTELAFLLENGAARKILYDFYIAQENYIEALNQWNLRSAFHLEQLQPTLAASGVTNGSVVTEDLLRKALGEQVFGHAVNSTNNCIVALRRAYQRLLDVKAIVRPYLVHRFRTNDFTDFVFPEGLFEEESQAK